MNFTEFIVNENKNGQGVYEEISHFDGEPALLIQGFEYERAGFDGNADEAGVITITAIRLPDDKNIGIIIPNEIDCEPDWSDRTETAPVKAIGAYASGTAKRNDSFITAAELPDTLKSVGKCAFAAWCSMKSIKIPAEVTEIGEYAFGYIRDSEKNGGESYRKIDGFVIFCYPGTAGEKYADDNGFEYVLLTD